jgi:hypothetical protein
VPDLRSFVFGGSEHDPFTGGGALPWINYNRGGLGTGPQASADASSPTAAAKTATEFNLGNAGDTSKLSDLINSINLKAQQTANQARIPGAAGLEAKSSANIGQELAGGVPSDVMNLLQQQGAERGAASGFGADSANTGAAYLRALGLTSLGQEQAGQQNLSAAYARNPGAPLFDPTSQLLSPGQQENTNLGYISEANRAAEAQQRLAIEAAGRGYGGGGRGGGYSYGAPAEAAPNYGFTYPPEVVGTPSATAAPNVYPPTLGTGSSYSYNYGPQYGAGAPAATNPYSYEGGAGNYSNTFNNPDYVGEIGAYG